MLTAGVGKGTMGMDILHLIERLENLAVASPKVPMMGKVMVDPQEMLDLVDQMRIALPESVREAQRLLDERGRRSRPDALATLPLETRRGVESHDLVKLAEQQAQEIVSRAERDAENLLQEARQQAEELDAAAEARRRGADDYALDVLGRLESQLGSMMSTVRRGIEALETESSQSQP